MRDEVPAESPGVTPGDVPVVDEATLMLLRRLLTLPDADVRRVRSATRRPPRQEQSGPSADYRDG